MKTTTELKPVYTDLRTWDSRSGSTSGTPTPEAVWQWLKEGTVVIWLHHGVFTGKVVAGEAPWFENLKGLDWDEHLVELRAFNPGGEWRLWRSGGKILGRKRLDCPPGKEEEGTGAIDTQMKLRGVVAEPLQGGKETLLLKTRNYLGMNGMGMVGYVDMRFLEIDNKIKGGVK